ncbi:hypothetical protein H9Q09_01195 [Aurantimonas sp. DM33-3]|uniref:hypothetical protein n=1 Tax=Aurantimonas sp. DM33-3 TaxID=2766955 RepID=UPI00165271AF|nr:hypothetical protein [Aurantimonas sp. DM33-3]MBC6714800.1 hypothetical protein [Aurantimonas sp. DM33-3]
MTYARIVDGVAVEVIAWSPEGRYPAEWTWAEAPEGTQQGATYDGEAFTNPSPAPVDPAPAPRRLKLTPSEFRNAFSAFEEVAIVEFSTGSDPSDTAETTTLRKVVGVFFDRLKDPHLTTVDLEDPRNLAGLDILVSQGILTVERRATIASGLPA